MNLRNTIKKALTDSFIIWMRELKNIRKDIGVVIFFVLVPVAYPVLYGLIYNPEVIRNVPMVVVDQSQTSLSREFVRKIEASPDVSVYTYAATMDEAKQVVDYKKAYGILFIPTDFSTKIHRGEQTTVSLFVDMSGLLFYKALLLATTEATFEMRSLINPGGTKPPVDYEAINLYNPQGGFASFLLPAILVLVIMQTLSLGISMLAATTRERNRGALIPLSSAYAGTSRIIFGKAMAYLTVYIFICIWAFIIVPNIFKLPQITTYGTLMLFLLPYLLASIFYAMTISTFIRGRETPMMILVFTSLPLLFLSGVSWPSSAIPDLWKWFSYLFPSTFGIQGFVKLNSMGAALEETAFEYQALWIQTGIYFILTFLIYSYNVVLRGKK